MRHLPTDRATKSSTWIIASTNIQYSRLTRQSQILDQVCNGKGEASLLSNKSMPALDGDASPLREMGTGER
jgi:hypothetical protein